MHQSRQAVRWRVNSIHDLRDPQKFLQGVMSVTMSVVVCGEAKIE